MQHIQLQEGIFDALEWVLLGAQLKYGLRLGVDIHRPVATQMHILPGDTHGGWNRHLHMLSFRTFIDTCQRIQIVELVSCAYKAGGLIHAVLTALVVASYVSTGTYLGRIGKRGPEIHQSGRIRNAWQKGRISFMRCGIGHKS